MDYFLDAGAVHSAGGVPVQQEAGAAGDRDGDAADDSERGVAVLLDEGHGAVVREGGRGRRELAELKV